MNLWRTGGMPEMVFEYILRQNNIDPVADVTINQSIDFGSTAAAFSGGLGEFTVEFSLLLHPLCKIIGSWYNSGGWLCR